MMSKLSKISLEARICPREPIDCTFSLWFSLFDPFLNFLLVLSVIFYINDSMILFD